MINWKSGHSGLSQWDVCVETNSRPVQAEKDISFDRRSWCGASFDLVWGCPRGIAVDRCGGSLAFFADKVSFWSICWVCLDSFASPLTISSTCSRACVNISGFQTSREWGQRWCLGSLHQGQGSGQRGWCPTWDGYHGPPCNLLQCCSRCTRPDQAIVVEGIMVQLAIMVHDIWFNLYAQYECWSNHSYMKSRPFCSRLPQPE